MIDLSDVTLMIPIRIDSADRQNNLDFIIKYVTHYFNTNIIIYESDKLPIIKDKYNSDTSNIIYHFNKDDNPVFHRTRFLNEMIKMSQTPIVVNYDADVFFRPENYIIATEILRKNLASLVFPYDGEFWDVNRNVTNINPADIGIIEYGGYLMTLLNDKSYGGAIFFNKDDYISGGMENQNFIGWGHEDKERIHRFNMLDYNYARLSGKCYHLMHYRGFNSNDANPNNEHNTNTYGCILAMNKVQLKNHIKTWEWLLK